MDVLTLQTGGIGGKAAGEQQPQPQPSEGGGHYIHQRRFEKPKKKKQVKVNVRKIEEFTIEELLVYERFLERFAQREDEKEKQLQGLLLERELWDANRDEVSRVIARIEENKRIRKKRNEDAFIAILLAA